VNGDYNFFLRF